MCDSGIEAPERPENPEWIWKNAKAPCWVTCCVMGTQQTLKQYALIFPPLQPFTMCINPILNPILGMLDYCVVRYTMTSMKFGNEEMAFTGNCCSYHQALCCGQCKTCLTCSIWFNCMGGMHVMPTYLDQHICKADNQANFVPGTRWQDAGECKEHFTKIRASVLDATGPPFDDHMYIMQLVPAPPCCEACKGMCAGFGDKSMLHINNQLRYVRIANRQLRFTGDAAGFNALRPGCCYTCGYKLPCYLCHSMMGTYTTAYKQYIDNHLEWLPEGHNAGGVERSLAEGASSALGGLTSAFGGSGKGSGTGSIKMAVPMEGFGSGTAIELEPNPGTDAPGQQAS